MRSCCSGKRRIPSSRPREYVFAEQAHDDVLTGTEMMTMIRGHRWKLVHYLGNDDGELYDLQSDPGEHVNLWAAPSYRDRREHLLRAMGDWLMRSSLKTTSWKSRWR